MKLSICIPTHNRKKFLAEALKSIISQASDEIEITISDNASTDGTKELVRSFQKDFPRITYSRFSKNLGPDRNFLRAIELAKGEYCWFLGSDDRIEADGIKKVLHCLSIHPNLTGISVNATAYDINFEKTVYSTIPTTTRNTTLFLEWEKCLSELFIYFGGISSHIFNREKWNMAVSKSCPQKLFNAYIHVYLFSVMVIQNPTWLYLHESIIGSRRGNDSFMTYGLAHRFKIDAIGYPEILRALENFPKPNIRNKAIQKNILNRLLKEVVRSYAICAATNSQYIKERTAMRKTAIKAFKSSATFWLSIVWWFFLPSFTVKILRSAYRRLGLKKRREN